MGGRKPITAAEREIQDAFGQLIRDARLRLGRTQSHVGAAAGIHATQVSGIELGRTGTSLGNAVRLARSLGVSLDELFAFGLAALEEGED